MDLHGEGIEAVRPMMGRTLLLLWLILSAAVACSGSEGEADAVPCPTGTIQRDTGNEIAGPGAESREDAMRAELEDLGMESSDEAISAGVVASSPGASPGTEKVEILTSEGFPVTMTLAPLDPGWMVERAGWCAPIPG